MRAVVPDVELWHRRVPAHAPAVGLDPGGDRGSGPGRLDPVPPRCHHKTGGKTLDVPLERAGKGLVEVAQVEGQVPLRRGPQSEVQHVSVPAQLHRQPAVQLAGEVGSHDRRGAPVVIPRRGRHPLMPDGNQLRDPDLVLRLDRLQRVMPTVCLRPGPQRSPADPLPGRLPRCAPLAARRREIPQHSGRAGWYR
jgi:hypothetical protein